MSIGTIIPNIEDINLPPVNLPPVVTPTVDPNFASGFNYARSIAGGLPMEQVIAPGVSFSPEQPGGFTQAQLGPVMTDMANIVTDAPPDMPFSDADAPDYGNLPPNIIGGGMGDNITILQDQMRFPPPIDILGGFNFVPQIDISSIPQSPIMPPKPPSIGGVGGTDIEDRLSIAKRPISPPPLEDFGFGPGIRRSEDFFIPEELMMPELNIPESVTKKDINEALLQIDTPPVINTPDITQGLFNLQAPQVPILQTPQVSSGGRFLRQDMTPSLFR